MRQKSLHRVTPPSLAPAQSSVRSVIERLLSPFVECGIDTITESYDDGLSGHLKAIHHQCRKLVLL